MTQADVLPDAKLRVLIADDFQETRRSVRLMLSMNPAVVVVAIARDGREAVELAAEYHPDLVVLDINMPRLDGLNAFREISQANPDTGCVFVTGRGDIELLADAMSLGAHEYLLKPFAIEELNEAVNRVGLLIRSNRQKQARFDQSNRLTGAELNQLAEEYAHTRRVDDQALLVFEKLAENPNCDIRWLSTLAMIYVIRQDWTSLKTLASRLEHKAVSVKR